MNFGLTSFLFDENIGFVDSQMGSPHHFLSLCRYFLQIFCFDGSGSWQTILYDFLNNFCSIVDEVIDWPFHGDGHVGFDFYFDEDDVRRLANFHAIINNMISKLCQMFHCLGGAHDNEFSWNDGLLCGVGRSATEYQGSSQAIWDIHGFVFGDFGSFLRNTILFAFGVSDQEIPKNSQPIFSDSIFKLPSYC